jgi:hypothetical protein
MEWNWLRGIDTVIDYKSFHTPTDEPTILINNNPTHWKTGKIKVKKRG